MKRYISSLLVLWFTVLPLVALGTTDDYDPVNPPNPQAVETTYQLITQVSPARAGSVNVSGSKYTAGASVYMYVNSNSGYKFKHWTKNGEVISTSSSFYYTMPASDATLVAVFEYNPNSPDNPTVPETKYQLNVWASPSQGGSFNYSTGQKFTAGESVSLYAYPKTNYVFKHWEAEGIVASTNRTYNFIMGEKAMNIVGVFEYNPSSPGNPGANSWDEATGELIIDDFVSGNLSNAVYNTTNGNTNKVQSLIVCGRLQGYDIGNMASYPFSLMDFSRCSEATNVPSWSFNGNTTLTSISLPSSIKSIDRYAFSDCSSLTTLNCYATVPPTLGSYVFNNIKDNLTVFVPASSIDLYQEAAGWKDLTILPLRSQVNSLEVKLPAGSEDGRFKNMFIELVNAKSGQRMRYVITDRVAYTFQNLMHNTVWNVSVTNANGQVLGELANIEIGVEDRSVMFQSLIEPQTIKAVVLNPNGVDVTGQTQLTWMQADGTYLGQGSTVNGILPLDGTAVKLRVTLPQTMAMELQMPSDTLYTVKNANNEIRLQLVALPKATVTGTVRDMLTNAVLGGATVTVSQTLNGRYSKSFTTTANKQGVYSLEVFDAPTNVMAVATDYISKTATYETLSLVDGVATLEDIGLKSINGATITVSFTYTQSAVAGTQGETQEYFADYQNVAYTIRDITTGQDIRQFNVQYPQIVLLEDVALGDSLQLTATSKTGAFVPVVAKGQVDAMNRANVTFDIKQLGQISASFVSTENTSVNGILYDSKGKFVKSLAYTNAKLNFTELQDGDYTLVTMGSSKLFNTIYNLAKFAQTGLVEGTDYVATKVTVQSGLVSTVKNAYVPYFDESKLYYTGDNTTFTVNKSQITAGNYLTINSRIDFKNVYAGDVSDVKLIVDLPESCSLVENSVMVGSSIASYLNDRQRVTIPVDNIGDRIRFCVIPTSGGDHAPSAYAQFMYNGQQVTQPIGSANFSVKDLSISVPSVVAKTTIPINGTAVGKSQIQIFDNGSLIGETTSLANGSWATTCNLDNPYNLSKHQIYAKITTQTGLEMQSETQELTYDMNAIQISKVTMYHYNPEMNKTFASVFDFLHPSTKANQWTVYYPKKVFTYTLEFTNNSPEKVSNVILYVHAADGQVVPLYPKYDVKKDLWVADIDMGNRGDSYYPVNVSVDYDVFCEKVIDRKAIDDGVNNINSMVDESRVEREILSNEINKEPIDNPQCIALESLINQENASVNDIVNILDEIIDDTTPTNTLSFEDIMRMFEEYELIFKTWQNDSALSIVNEAIDDVYIDTSVSFDEDFNYSQQFEEYIKICQKEKLSSVNVEELLLDGFVQYRLTDNTEIYYRFSDKGIEIIDVANLVSYKTINSSEILNTRLTRKLVSSNLAGYVDCGRKVVELMKSIYANRNQDSKNQLLANTTLFGQLINSACCYYEGFRADLQYAFESKQKERVSSFEAKIKEQKNIKAATEGSLKSYEGECKVLEREWKDLIHSYNDIEGSTNLTAEAKAAKLESLSAQIDAKVNRLTKVKGFINEETKALNKIIKNIDKLESQLKALKKAGEVAAKALSNCPLKVVRGVRIPPVLRLSGKLAGEFGIALQAACLILDCYDTYDDLMDWVTLVNGIEAKIPCEANPEAALSLQDRIIKSAWNHWSAHTATLSGEVAAIGFSAAGGVFLSPTWWTEMVISAICEWAKKINLDTSSDAQTKYWMEISQLRCKKCENGPCPDGDSGGSGSGGPGGGNGGNGGAHGSGSPNDGVWIDPSGYVYEGVPSNRLEGVTATAYYKETVEDMYGDQHENIVLWDAGEYAQENPLFTNEYGMYAWDVPQGLWQVKFEKEGYQTTYSEWLPVPPPQLEVNIAMTQASAPTVKGAKAYEDGVEVEFDKFMQTENLTTDNIYVKKNGVKINDGTIELLNSESTDENNENGPQLASRVKFVVPEGTKLLSTDEVTLIVGTAVTSYAGVPLQEVYSQTFDVEKAVREIATDSLLTVLYEGTRTLQVSALPADAAMGKKLRVRTLSTLIADVTADGLTPDEDGSATILLDETGQATLTVSGELPGSTALQFSIDDTNAKGQTLVKVDQAASLVTPNPRASRASGTAVYRGTLISLSCENEKAKIWYTLDGSCPCNTETALVYTQPIAINDDHVTIKAMAQADGYEESEVVIFEFTAKQNTQELALSEGWNWVSHNQARNLTLETLPAKASEIKSQTRSAIRDEVYGLFGNLSELSPIAAYKVKATESTVWPISGDAYNASKSVITLMPGWNWLGYPMDQVMSVDEAFANLSANDGDVVVGLSGSAEFVAGQEKWIGDLATMDPGQGYMLKSSSSNELLYNTSIVSRAKSINSGYLLRKLAPWSVDEHTYSSVMPVRAQLYHNDVLTEDDVYTVAAFNGTECRGIGKYVEGVIFMNVHGDKQEDITFLAAENEGENIFEIEETIPFHADIVGSYREPYALHLGKMADGIVRHNQRLGVWPAIATTQITVSLGGLPIERLTLTGADGRMIRIASQGDTEQTIRLTGMAPGVYIVAAKSGGETFYRKIMKVNK